MRIKSLRLKNFKRFPDLTLQNLPEYAKPVLLIGSNGSGKSSVFDGYEYLSDEYETFYKVFPAKDFGTTLKERQNVLK